jgi:hypothetical protein
MRSMTVALKRARTVVDRMTESDAVISDERTGVQSEEPDR